MIKRISGLSFTLLIFFVSLLVISCGKETDSMDEEVQNQNQNSYFQLDNRDDEENEYGDSTECFQFVYPVEISFPDGTTVSVSSDTDLENAIDTWFENNPDAEEYPMFVYPISVVLEDGTSQTLNNEEELCDLFFECEGDYEDDGEWEDDGDWEDGDSINFEDLCFTIIYSINAVQPDGTVVQINNDEELFEFYAQYEEGEQEPTLEYPIEVTLEDGTIQTVASDEDFEELVISCFPDYDDEGEWEPDDSLNISELCFTLTFPIDIQLPDGTIVTVNSPEEFFELHEQYCEEGNEPVIQYPIEATLEDGTVVSIGNDEELDDLIESCFPDLDDDDDDDDDNDDGDDDDG